MNNEDFTIALIALMTGVRADYGPDVEVGIRADDYGVAVTDVVTGKLVYAADTLVEFTSRYL